MREPEHERSSEDRDSGRGGDRGGPRDARRLEAVGRLVDRLVRPGTDDPLVALFERTAAEARAVGLTEAEIEAELAAHKAERRG